ncbi:CHAT domain-containing protein [Roseivirga misakiensis]|uniref:CHAT domain-containing protein n=1 Tax=Roseivirga misakiensis TaxID=1563681 RepID=A0A1E5T6B1_9BACT|nr:CHAT domain-containing tetratricopeptide repeat protein [Roseivirga misakiensis]OEK06903.1 hypothetical protein BFP71_04410 [Roseivirga misakiensis]
MIEQLKELRLITILLILGGLVHPLLNYQLSGQDNAELLMGKAKEYSQIYDFDNAIETLERASSLYLKKQDSLNYFFARIKVASQLAKKRSFEEAYSVISGIINRNENSQILLEAYITKAEILRLSRKWPEVLETLNSTSRFMDGNSYKGVLGIARSKVIQGKTEAATGKFTEALTSLTESLAIYDSLNLKPELAQVYYELGRVNSMNSDPNNALIHLNKADLINTAVASSKKSFFIAKVYSQLGMAYSQLGMYPNALQELFKATDIARELNPESEELIIALTRISGVYNDMEQPKEGISSMKEAANLAELIYGQNSLETIATYRALGRAYLVDGVYNGAYEIARKNALASYNKALELLKTHFPEEQKNLATLTYDIGTVELYFGNADEGLRLMANGLEIAMKIPFGFKPKATKLANDLAVAFLSKPEGPQPDSAMKYFQKALVASTKNFKSELLEINPQIDDVVTTYEFYRAIIGKSYSMDIKYEIEPKTELLTYAFDATLIADSIANKLRELPLGYTNKTILNSGIAESQHYAIRIAHKLFEITADYKYAEFAYTFFEKSKANQAFFDLNPPDIPKSYIDQEEAIGKELSLLETLVYTKESKIENLDNRKLKDLKERILQLNKQLLGLRQKIKRDFPNYYSLKYNNNYLNIDETREKLLGDKELLLNYNIFGRSMYSFRIDKSGFDFIKHLDGSDSTLFKYIDQFTRQLKRPGSTPQNISEMKSSSSKLSELLFTDSLDFSRYNKVTIIADGILHKIPFEVLLTKGVDAELEDHDLPFLIKTHDVRYATSATSLKQLNSSKKHSGQKVLAFAPLFNIKSTNNPSNFDSTRATMGNLAYTQGEVTAIKDHFDTKLLLDLEATERAFRKNASDYAVVHLATHGIIDEENSLYSRLLFSPFDQDSISDGYLNMREILGLDVPANMVVLSACNSGSGKILSGEGALSIANGFFYAGAKSVIMTHWTANDNSTANIMGAFYSYLAKGQTKSQAMRNAKLAYLRENDGLLAHPYYWAHFTVNGDDSPIVKAGIAWYYWIIILLISIGVIGLMIRRKKTALSLTE